MRVFSALYDRAMIWAVHRHAPWYLGGLSFAESSFFPIPPDVMLAPMSLARTDRAWWYAALTTATSVLGGLFGYLIGMLAIDAVLPWIVEAGYGARYEQAIEWFATWGVWVVFIAGFSPIPYKLFTIAAGASAMPLLPFTLASLVGRGARFFLVAGLMRWGGAPMERLLRSYIDRLGWLVIFLGVAYVLIAG
ncbi:MAG: YqaA family protein [Gammaproteobacteria bacterium]|nr:YqaA family protein [Gammaproteobacteria bacterium]